MPTQKPPTSPKKKIRNTPIYQLTISADWFRFYRKDKLIRNSYFCTSQPLCEPDLIVKIRKEPVDFLTPEVATYPEKIQGSWRHYRCYTTVDIIRNEDELLNWLREHVFYKGDIAGHRLQKKWQIEGGTTIKPNVFVQLIRKFIKSGKVDLWFDKCYFEKKWGSPDYPVNIKDFVTEATLKNLANPNFFIPKVNFESFDSRVRKLCSGGRKLILAS